jgi:hypothetical protein
MPSAKLAFSPDPRRVHQVRLLISNMVLLATNERGKAGRIAMVAAELAEYLIDHARGQLVLQALVEVPSRTVTLVFEADIQESALEELTGAAEATAGGDPIKVFSRELALSRDQDGVPLRLRLARIRCEGEMAIRWERTERGVRILAEPAPSPVVDLADEPYAQAALH